MELSLPTKVRLFVVAGTALILSVPLIAMQFTEEVQWGPFDFAIIALLLLGAGFIFELVTRHITDPSKRSLWALAFIFGVLVIWADLAVGIFNIPGISGS